MQEIFEPGALAKSLRRAKQALKVIDFDSIAFTGNSGAIFAGALAATMGKGLFLVRKPDDSTHSDYSVEGDSGFLRYLFVDDFISTGVSRDRVKEAMTEEFPSTTYVGQYMYREDHRSYGFKGV